MGRKQESEKSEDLPCSTTSTPSGKKVIGGNADDSFLMMCCPFSALRIYSCGVLFNNKLAIKLPQKPLKLNRCHPELVEGYILYNVFMVR